MLESLGGVSAITTVPLIFHHLFHIHVTKVFKLRLQVYPGPHVNYSHETAYQGL